MKHTITMTLLALGLAAGAYSQQASDSRSRALHITKECNSQTGTYPGSYCTIQTSNIAAITKDSMVFYDQVGILEMGVLDSNVFLKVDANTWAVGRCTAPFDSTPGLCTFSDGVGKLKGFHARIVVTGDSTDPMLYHWDGTYSFGEPDDDR